LLCKFNEAGELCFHRIVTELKSRQLKSRGADGLLEKINSCCQRAKDTAVFVAVGFI